MDGAVQDGADSVIRDFRRVTDLDTTGARLLVQAAQKLEVRAKTLGICGVSEGTRVHRIMEDTGLLAADSTSRSCPDADHAMEWADDRLLERLADSEVFCHELAQEGFDALSRTHPRTAVKLTGNIARELAGRLRDLHKVISELEK